MKLKCIQCGTEVESDQAVYIGKKPHCSVDCAKKTLEVEKEEEWQII